MYFECYFRAFDPCTNLLLFLCYPISNMMLSCHYISHKSTWFQIFITFSILMIEKKFKNWHRAHAVTDPSVYDLGGVRAVLHGELPRTRALYYGLWIFFYWFLRYIFLFVISCINQSINSCYILYCIHYFSIDMLYLFVRMDSKGFVKPQYIGWNVLIFGLKWI